MRATNRCPKISDCFGKGPVKFQEKMYGTKSVPFPFQQNLSILTRIYIIWNSTESNSSQHTAFSKKVLSIKTEC